MHWQHVQARQKRSIAPDNPAKRAARRRNSAPATARDTATNERIRQALRNLTARTQSARIRWVLETACPAPTEEESSPAPVSSKYLNTKRHTRQPPPWPPAQQPRHCCLQTHPAFLPPPPKPKKKTMNHSNNGFQTAAMDADQISETINGAGIEILLTLEGDGICCFVCSGKYEGDFLVYQSTTTGHGFTTQAAGQDPSIHQSARDVLQDA